MGWTGARPPMAGSALEYESALRDPRSGAAHPRSRGGRSDCDVAPTPPRPLCQVGPHPRRAAPGQCAASDSGAVLLSATTLRVPVCFATRSQSPGHRSHPGEDAARGVPGPRFHPPFRYGGGPPPRSDSASFAAPCCARILGTARLGGRGGRHPEICPPSAVCLGGPSTTRIRYRDTLSHRWVRGGTRTVRSKTAETPFGFPAFAFEKEDFADPFP